MRIFVYDQREFPDPDPSLSLEEVKRTFSDFFPEVATAEVRTTQRGEEEVHEFVRRVGTKGGVKQGWHDLVVIIQCERCQALIYRKIYQGYQTKGGRWQIGIRIDTSDLEPHSCPNPKILSGR